jgi:hypothetical protein
MFSSRPWTPEDGDPAHPESLRGVPVLDKLASRDDAPAAVVRLADGTVAVTGTALARGSVELVRRYARRRHRASADPAERQWWDRVLHVLQDQLAARPRTGRRPLSRTSQRWSPAR